MREHVSQSKKATTASFSIPSLKHRIPGFGSDSSQASPQAVPLVQPLHKPLTHNISRIPLRNPQAKLSISQPGDKYEQEADSVAQQVMQRIAQPVNRQSIQPQALPESEELQMKPIANSITPLVQREALPEEEEELQMKSLDNSTLQRQQAPEDESELQMKSMVQRQAGMAAAPDLETSINQARGGGVAMAENIRHPMEVAFGADFSGVKVHTDGQSDQLNRSIQARAFTTGQDVFFRQGEYNPGSRGGQELLAHELTHVLQQNGGAVQRQREITTIKSNFENSALSISGLIQRTYIHEASSLDLSDEQYKAIIDFIDKYDVAVYADFGRGQASSSQSITEEARIGVALSDLNEYINKQFPGRQKDLWKFVTPSQGGDSFQKTLDECVKGKECNNKLAKHLRACMNSFEHQED